MKTPILSAILVAVATIGFLAVAQGQSNLVAVVNAQNDASGLDSDRMRSIFLGTTSYWAGNLRITPIDRPNSSSAGKAFLRGVMHMAPSRYRHHWMRLQLSGQANPPSQVSSARSVVAKVASNRSAISYLTTSEAAAFRSDRRIRFVNLR